MREYKKEDLTEEQKYEEKRRLQDLREEYKELIRDAKSELKKLENSKEYVHAKKMIHEAMQYKYVINFFEEKINEIDEELENL